jgi:hypothetical protein
LVDWLVQRWVETLEGLLAVMSGDWSEDSLEAMSEDW